MTTPIYTTNYRKNLTLYWRQFYPDWTIPEGYQVHHIKPQSTFQDKSDPRINHPKNLIALHPDDHISIHKCRGDKQLSHKFITSTVGRVMSEYNKQKRRNYKHTTEAKLKISKTHKGKPKSKEHREKLSISTKGKPKEGLTIEQRMKLSKALKGRTFTKEHRKKISKALKGRIGYHKGKPKSKEHCENLSKGKLGKKIYNNGISNKYFIEGSQPSNYILGKMKHET